MRVDGTRRWTLLPFIGLAAWQARGYLTDNPRRFSSPTFDAPRQLGTWLLPDTLEPMRAWGVVFLLGALALVIAAVRGSYNACAIALFLGGFVYLCWAFILTFGALTEPRAATTGIGQYAFDAAVHFLAVLLLRERQIRAKPTRRQANP